jgi:hypothetical protein
LDIRSGAKIEDIEEGGTERKNVNNIHFQVDEQPSSMQGSLWLKD